MSMVFGWFERKEAPLKPLFLLLLTVCLAFTAFFAENYIFTHLHHDHDREGSGGSCSVCYKIELARFLLEGLGRAGAAALVAGLILRAPSRVKNAASLCREALRPIELKVRLNC